MAQGIAGAGNQRHYGATDGAPEVAFARGWGTGGLAGGIGGLDNGASQFSPTELYNLCENITTNIYSINHGRKTLEQELRHIGTVRDTSGLRDRVHVTYVSCNELVTQTTKELTRLTEVVRRGNKEQKLQAERLREEFSEAVTDIGRVQKQITEKMKLHLPSMPQGYPNAGTSEDDSEHLIAAEQKYQEQMLKQNAREFEAGLLEEYAQRIQMIENNVIDVNQTIRHMQSIVLHQGETVSRLEDNIENAHGNVETGRQELQKAETYQNKSRRKLLCLLMTATIVAMILGIILYVSIKS